jgi:predicted phosphodiesterase
MSKNKLNTEVVKEYLKLYQNTPSLSLAQKIYAENSKLFNDVESVRSSVRYHRGRSGHKHRGNLSDTSIAENYNEFKLPDSDAEDYDPFYITGENKTLLFSDLHLPYHDVNALNVMLRYAQDREYTSIILNGDIWDFHQLSYFVKDPRARNMKFELDTGKAFLRRLRELFPTQKIYYKIGNHEERWEKYLMTKAPELFSTEMFHLQDLFPFYDLGIEVISDQRIIKLGKLNVLHGHELKMNAINVNPARTVFLKTYESTIVGHSHRTSEHTEPDLSGDIITCWSVGCMSGLHPAYARINKYNHGFASIRIDSDGHFNVKNRRIVEGEVR